MGYHGVCPTISLRARGVPSALVNFSLRCHGVLTASNGALIRTPNDGVCFERVQKKRLPLAFYDFRRCSAEFPTRCQCVGGVGTELTSVFCFFVERRKNATLV